MGYLTPIRYNSRGEIIVSVTVIDAHRLGFCRGPVPEKSFRRLVGLTASALLEFGRQYERKAVTG